jgi:hypothetical protein
MYDLLEDGLNKPDKLVERARHRIKFLKSITVTSSNAKMKSPTLGDVSSAFLLNQEKLMKRNSMFNNKNRNEEWFGNSFGEDKITDNNLLYWNRPSNKMGMFEESKRESFVSDKVKDAMSLDVGFESELPRIDSNHLYPDICELSDEDNQSDVQIDSKRISKIVSNPGARKFIEVLNRIARK